MDFTLKPLSLIPEGFIHPLDKQRLFGEYDGFTDTLQIKLPAISNSLHTGQIVGTTALLSLNISFNRIVDGRARSVLAELMSHAINYHTEKMCFR
jgi:hypothetical protein